jgi:hypothetical protein
MLFYGYKYFEARRGNWGKFVEFVEFVEPPTDYGLLMNPDTGGF